MSPKRITIYGYKEEHTFNWVPLEGTAREALAREIQKWAGTPYVEGAQIAGEGADCFRSVTGIENGLRGEIVMAPEELPADAGMNNPAEARKAMRRLLRAYEATKVTDGTLQPGNFLITKPRGKNSGPGHAMIAGVNGQLWHMDYRAGFVATGPSLEGNTLEGIYQTDISKWVSKQ